MNTRPYSKNTYKGKRVKGMTPEVERPPSKCKDLSSNSNTTKTKPKQTTTTKKNGS
jgi:hypothetical protein